VTLTFKPKTKRLFFVLDTFPKQNGPTCMIFGTCINKDKAECRILKWSHYDWVQVIYFAVLFKFAKCIRVAIWCIRTRYNVVYQN